MTQQRLQLILFSDDAEAVAGLRKKFETAASITVAKGNGPSVSRLYHLDALWVTPMQASYFGVSKLLPTHDGQVFAMPLEKKQKGLPRFLITSPVMTSEDLVEPRFAVELCVRALAEAVSKYNRTHPVPILRIGSTPGNLCLDNDHAMLAVRALRQSFSSLESNGPQAQTVKQFA